MFIGSFKNSIYGVNAATGAVLWTTGVPAAVTSSPTLSNGGDVLYIGCNDHLLYALDSSTGVVRWNFTTQDKVKSSPSVSPDDALVYVGTDAIFRNSRTVLGSNIRTVYSRDLCLS